MQVIDSSHNGWYPAREVEPPLCVRRLYKRIGRRHSEELEALAKTLRPNYPHMARNRTRAERRAAKRKAAPVVVSISDDRLRSILGLMLRRLWLYSHVEVRPAYQVDSMIAFGKPLSAEREGFTQYYR